MRSFLNLIEIDSAREIRLAEFGFEASEPSFCGDQITFMRDGRRWQISPQSGMISPFEAEISPMEHGIELRFTSPFSIGIAYCEMVIGDRVLVRFMGSRSSIGAAPISPDGRTIVFFGYPADEFGE